MCEVSEPRFFFLLVGLFLSIDRYLKKAVPSHQIVTAAVLLHNH